MVENADLDGYLPTEADAHLDKIFNDHVHQNNGSHLHGDVADDDAWQRRWKTIVQVTPRRYNAPKGRVGRRFVSLLAQEFHGVRQRKWNSERPIVFVAVVLQKTPGVTAAHDIRRRLDV